MVGADQGGEASRVSAYVFLVPLVAVVLGALFLGETVGPSLLVGAALVVLGIYLVNRRGERPARGPERMERKRRAATPCESVDARREDSDAKE